MTDRAEQAPRIVRHTVAYEHPHGARLGGAVALSHYAAPGDQRTAGVVRYADTVPEGTTGRRAAPLLAQLLDGLPELAPIRLYLGVTVAGRDLAGRVIAPGVEAARAEQARAAEERGDTEARARARRSLQITSYAVDVGPAAAHVDKVVSVHRRTAAVATGLELDELKIPTSLPRAEELRRAIHTYNPVDRVTPEGHDTWGADPFEGLLVALTVAFTEGQVEFSRIGSPARVSLSAAARSRLPPAWSRRITGPHSGGRGSPWG